MPVTKPEIEAIVNGVMEAISEDLLPVFAAYKQRIADLEAKLASVADAGPVGELASKVAALEQRMGESSVYRGIYSGHLLYARNDMCTHMGSLWIASCDSRGTRPGEGGGWTLVSKGGSAPSHSRPRITNGHGNGHDAHNGNGVAHD
jgi:hypothetical protein